MDNQIPLAVQMAAKSRGCTNNIRKSATKWLGDDEYGDVQFIWDDLINKYARELELNLDSENT